MTITQTVEIPTDRRLLLDIEVPREIPAGKARVELKVIPFVQKQDKPAKLHLTKQQLDEMLQNAKTPHSDALAGLLAHLGDISLEEIRDERLARHLK